MLLACGTVQHIRPDVCLCGGITGAKKIDALAEAHNVGVAPHNPLGPMSTAACLQIAASIPNFALKECPMGDYNPPKRESEMVKNRLQREGGYLKFPDVPGSEMELIDDTAERFPYRPREVFTRLHEDGSVADM